jgi:hypothetical protein
MTQSRGVLSFIVVLAIVGTFAPFTVHGESRAPTGDDGDLLKDVDCPAGSGIPCYDAMAGGQKISGTLSVIYDKEADKRKEDGTFRCPTAPGRAFVRNMYVNLTMDQGNVRVPFSTDYLNGPPAHTEGFCLLTTQTEQAKVIIELVRAKVIPFFFSCDPATVRSCPNFRVKSVANFQYTTGHPSLAPYPYSGGFSADIVIATP